MLSTFPQSGPEFPGSSRVGDDLPISAVALGTAFAVEAGLVVRVYGKNL